MAFHLEGTSAQTKGAPGAQAQAGGSPQRAQLRGMNYADGAAALAPPRGAGQVQQRAAGGVVQRKRVPEAHPTRGLTGGQTSLEDFSGGAEPGADAVAKAQRDAAAEDQMSLAAQVASITTQTARSESDMLAAIKAGTTPRYVARVGPLAGFQQYMCFGNPGRPFIFATEPGDLRGSKPGEAMLKVGWTESWIRPNVGKEIVVCVFDTSVAVPDKDDPSQDKKVNQGRMEWPQLSAKALGDSGFVRACTAKGMSREDISEAFDVLANTPVKADPNTSDATVAQNAKIIRVLIDKFYGANELYTGMGATLTQHGDIGGREVMIEHNGTGLKLVPGNHDFASLGKLTQDEVDSLF